MVDKDSRRISANWPETFGNEFFMSATLCFTLPCPSYIYSARMCNLMVRDKRSIWSKDPPFTSDCLSRVLFITFGNVVFSSLMLHTFTTKVTAKYVRRGWNHNDTIYRTKVHEYYVLPSDQFDQDSILHTSMH